MRGALWSLLLVLVKLSMKSRVQSISIRLERLPRRNLWDIFFLYCEGAHILPAHPDLFLACLSSISHTHIFLGNEDLTWLQVLMQNMTHYPEVCLSSTCSPKFGSSCNELVLYRCLVVNFSHHPTNRMSKFFLFHTTVPRNWLLYKPEVNITHTSCASCYWRCIEFIF